MDNRMITHTSKAFGFTLMMLEGKDLPPSEAAARARQLARLIEEFCSLEESDGLVPVFVTEQSSTDRQTLLEEAAYALELCLTCPALTWEAEHEAEAVLNKIKRGIG